MKTQTNSHTHGLWHVNPRGFIVDSTGAIVTRMDCSEDAGNSSLVSAAPDLLAALVDMVAPYDGNPDGAPTAIKRARAAIAKAKGEANS